MVNTLLESWARYLESSQYLNEKARAQKFDGTNAEAVNEKRLQLELKMRVHQLRHRIRQAKALHRNQKQITDKNRELYDEWRSGKLTEEPDECIRAHGYGKLQSGFRGPTKQCCGG